jgi:hypothetical protein
VDKVPFVGFLERGAPRLEAGEKPVLATMASVTGRWWGSLRFGVGTLWLTDRRLIFQHQRLRLNFAPTRIEVERDQIISVRRRSMLHSVLGIPFMGSLEVRVTGGKRYNFQVMKANVWVAELTRLIHHTKS